MVRFNFLNQKLFYLYNPIEVINNKSDKSDKSDNQDYTILYIIIGISGFLIIVVIILVIFILLYKKSNKDLLIKVNKISFAESDAQEKARNSDSDNLLFGKNEN